MQESVIWREHHGHPKGPSPEEWEHKGGGGVGVKRSWEGGKAKPFKDGVGHVRDFILYPQSSNKSVKCLDKAMVQ